MVCLAAAVLTKGGKVLIARQFVEMPRMRIENLLATFPKLVGADKQHNTVETAEVRYVYQPIENLMVLLMTNKLSNIVADLELLRLFAKVLTEYCPGEIEEANVCKHAFELVFAFDEVVAMGHKENVTMRDIQINIEMESHEEKLSIMIRQSKEREARDKAKEKEKEIARNKGGGKMPGGIASLLQELVDTGEVEELQRPGAPATPAGGGGGAAPANRAMTEAIQLTVDEKVVVSMNRDGGLESMEVKGDLSLLITDPAFGKVTLPLRMGENAGFQFKTHPNINKQLFSGESTLGLKDASRAFPTGTALGVLKWRLATTDESSVPMLINCWPTPEANGGFTVNVEYELQQSQMELRDVHIHIPVPSADAPTIIDGEGASYNKRESLLTWVIPVVDNANGSGSIEFTAAVDSPDAFFPIDVRFHSQKTFCDLDVPTVVSAEDGSSMPFGKVGGLSVESYRVN
eukprot:Transcript_22779.p1 GENE.Transcript_22779~~Transcript_22779.p1  ORF type:complete len:461 (+),score=241.92 Transcript_22779:274-1656(+)